MNMNNLMIAKVLSNVWLITYALRTRRSEITKKFHRTGEAVAVNHKIEEYEREHQQFYTEETKYGNNFQWPALDNKNKSNFCRKYLQHSAHRRKTNHVIAIKILRTLYYEKINTSIKNEVVVAQCKIKDNKLSYYVTRAPEPNCVYALKCTGTRPNFILSIIFKHCDFENKPLIIESQKRKRAEHISKVEASTGQPIATDEYLMKYELEHYELVKKEGNGHKPIEWRFAVQHPNLDRYCYEYIGECVPNRSREGTRGKWKVKNIHYHKLDVNVEIKATIITCHTPDSSNRRYHITRAPETNCVYALLQYGRGQGKPAVIIFKHCDFKNSDNQQTSYQGEKILDKNIIPKIEAEEKMSVCLDPLQLFPRS